MIVYLRKLRFFLVLALIVVLSSCTSMIYMPSELEKKPKSELSFLGEFHGSLSRPGPLVSIDGTALPQNSSYGLYVLPGSHTITYRYSRKVLAGYYDDGEYTGPKTLVIKSGWDVDEQPGIRKCEIQLEPGMNYQYSEIIQHSRRCKALGYY